MTDIIQDAKRLLAGATPAPWEWVGYSIESVGGVVLDFQCATEFGMNGATREVEVTPEDEDLIAAAPKLAQALAEETYEYAVQFKNEESGKWYTKGFYGIGMHGQKWFTNREEAEQQIEKSYPTELVEQWGYRIVRRRVSLPEVIND